METQSPQRRSIFYPFGMVGACSIVASVLVLISTAQFFMLPQGSGLPQDRFFWRPVVPFAVVSVFGLGVSWVCPRGSLGREIFLSLGIAMGGGSIAFLLMLFTTAEREKLEEMAKPVAPENSYTCTRKADGGMECLNAFGAPDPNYSYTIVPPGNSRP